MAAMEKGGIKRLRIKYKDSSEIELERECESTVSHALPHPDFHPRFPSQTSVPHRGHEERIEEKKAPPAAEGKFILSPMVGTMYHAASPEDSPFVKVGDKVDENTVICIVEAMKVMNEVKAGMSGTVAEILVTNAHPVEFGTKIIRIV